MKRFKQFLATQRQRLPFLISFSLVIVIGLVDSLTGPELSLSAFYLIPIFVAGYYLGLKEAIWTSVLSIFVYLIADRILSITYTDSATPFWNAGIRFLFFLAVSYALHKRRTAEQELARSEERSRLYAKLHEIDRSILSAVSSEDIARRTLSQLQNLIDFRYGSIALFDLDTGHGKVIAFHPRENADLESHVFLLEENDVAELLQQHQICLAKGEPTPRVVTDSLPFDAITSFMIVSLVARGKLLGSMTLGKTGDQEFSGRDRDVSQEVARQACLALYSSKLFEELFAAHQRLQILSQRLLTIQENEKHHLARELHDEMGQSLTVLRIHLDELLSSTLDPQHKAKLEDSVSTVERILEQVRHLSLDLRPLILDDLGLEAALRWYVSRKAQIAGLTVHFQSDLNTKLPPEIETASFRIAQEAITNTIRHARAGKLHISLHSQNDRFELLLKDDGIGFDLESAKEKAASGKNLGLLGIRERVSLLGGEIEIDSFPSCGTQIFVRFPMNGPFEAVL